MILQTLMHQRHCSSSGIGSFTNPWYQIQCMLNVWTIMQTQEWQLRWFRGFRNLTGWSCATSFAFCRSEKYISLMMELKTKLSILNVGAGHTFLEQAALKVYSYNFFVIRRLTFSFESFGLLNDVFPFYTILDASCPIFDVQ